MVQTVKEKLKKYPSIIEAIFDAIDNIAIEATKILQRKLQIAEKQISGSVTNIDEDGSIAGAYFESENFSTNGSYEFNNVQYNSNTLAEPTRNGRSASVSSNSNCRKRDSNASNNSIDFQKSELHETFDKLNDLCRINNQLLISLGVGHAKVEQICTLLARFGIHPKMTGAGGGGCLFAFMKPDISQTVINMIRDELQKDGYEIWHPSLGGPGVILHSRRPSIFVENIEPRKERVHVVSEGMSSRKSKNDNSSLSLSSAKISLKSKLLNNASSSHQSTPSLKHKK